MVSRKVIEATLLTMELNGAEAMNGQERLMVRNDIARRDAARKRHQQNLESKGPYEWKKPAPKR